MALTTSTYAPITGQSQRSLRKAKTKAEALACVRSLFKAKLKAVAVHVMYDFIQQSIQKSHAYEGSPLKRKSAVLRAVCPQKSGGRPPRKKGGSQEGEKTSWRRHRGAITKKGQRKLSSQGTEQVVCNGDGGGREKAEELEGAGGVFARGPVAT
eukprot:6212521-Pleurochrysis_carterae.AAC.1